MSDPNGLLEVLRQTPSALLPTPEQIILHSFYNAYTQAATGRNMILLNEVILLIKINC